MNDTQQTPPITDPDDSFDPRRLRTITDMKRSTDDRLLGGVCAGAAKYLNIDPIIVRVVIAVLTFVGFAGLILYAAAWFLLPSEDSGKSVAADWFKLDKNEEQIRIIGLILAAILAAVAIVGDNGYAWWGVPWFLVPLAALYYVFVVRPRRHRAERQQREAASPAPPAPPAFAPTIQAKAPRQRKSPALTLLTISLAAIGVAVTRIYSELNDTVPWTAYVAVALGIVGIGLLIGTFFGHGGPLIPIGILLAIALAIGSLLPSANIGAERHTPLNVSQVDNTYRHGVGLLELDLTDLPDADQLVGRTIKVRAGIGQTKIIVPKDLNIAVQSHLDAGQVRIFDRRVDGTDNTLDVPAKSGPTLTIDIKQRLGNIEVISR